MDRSIIKYQEKASYAWSDDSIRLYGLPGSAVKNDYFYMQEAGYFKTEWPYFTERIYLNSFLIVYTLNGEGVLTYENKEYHLYPGSCFFIHCMKYHEYHTEKGKKWEFLWLHFNGAGAFGYYQQFVRDGFCILEEENALIEQQLRAILAVNQERSVTTEICTMRSIVDILTELVLKCSGNRLTMGRVPDYIKNAQRYMEKHFAEKISLDDLAGFLHISKFHLVREFSRWVGFSPYEYLIELRMAYAKEMLKYSETPVSEIALACGMNQPSYFIRLFKEREGKTPLQYRKEWNADMTGK